MKSVAQSIFSNASEETIGILYLWWILAGLGGIALLAAVAILIICVSRKSGAPNEVKTGRPYWLYAGVCFTLLAIFIVLIATFMIQPTVAAIPRNSMQIEVVGKQWWWEINYLEEGTGKILFTTANELVIPVHSPVHLRLKSADVIHSFWVPALAGKVDLLPGQTNNLVLEAKKQGVFRGQCAEFCGLQHAKMGILVTAVTEDQFAAWLSVMVQPHEIPSQPEEKKGLNVFREAGCSECHAIRGLAENSSGIGPDLSHLSKRQTLASAVMPNHKGNLTSWVANPASAKIGTAMPRTLVTGPEFHALISFLESLE